MELLIAVDLERCQAEKSNGQTFMTLGGGHRLVRCTNKPVVILKEVESADDECRGSMSVCAGCLAVALEQLPEGFFEVVDIKSRTA